MQRDFHKLKAKVQTSCNVATSNATRLSQIEGTSNTTKVKCKATEDE